MAKLPGSTLTVGTTMNPGDYILSAPNGVYQLTMQQNGDLTYGLAGETAPPPPWKWETKTFCPLPTCKMTPQGDLGIYSDGTLVYHTKTFGPGAYVTLSDTGEVQIVNKNGTPFVPPWVNGPIYPVTPMQTATVEDLVRHVLVVLEKLQSDVAQVQMIAERLEDALLDDRSGPPAGGGTVAALPQSRA